MMCETQIERTVSVRCPEICRLLCKKIKTRLTEQHTCAHLLLIALRISVFCPFTKRDA